LNTVAEAGSDSAAETPRKRRRWPRRLLAAFAALFLLVTSFSFIYNAVTAGAAREPGGLHFAEAGGIRTRYREWGGNGPPIVLVHGFAESADTFDPLGNVLAAHWHVYAIDLTGWGYSQRKGPYNVHHQASQVLGFLGAMHLPAAALVGHSTGAAVVAEAALREPSRVSRLIFLDGDGLNTGAGSQADWLKSILFDPYRTTLYRLLVGSDWMFRNIYDSNCGPGCPPLDHRRLEEWRRPFQVKGAEGSIWEMLSIVGLPAGRVAELARLPMPKSVIFGAEDDVFSRSAPYETARRIGAPPPTIIPGARHLSFISQPGRVAAAITAS
jgi:pimeloyl-ACP methyl ester carboxylesterase